MGAAALYSAFMPYPHTALADVDFAQTADVIYLAHLDYPLWKLTRADHTDWTASEVTFGPTINAPGAPTGTASTPNTTGYVATNYKYKITAIGGEREQESRASGELALTNDLTLSGNYNTINIPAPSGDITRHVVYKEQGGSFGYIGGTDGTTFVDGNPAIQPDLSDTPPIGENPFDTYGNYPSTVTFHDQRLQLARTRNNPNAGWGSQPGDFENMDRSRPAKPDDALSYALVAERVNSINQLASMDDLMALTSDGTFAISGDGNGGPMTPAEIVPKRQSGRGSGRLNPIILDSVLFYRPNRGSTIRTLNFSFEVDGYKSNNVTIFSPHFFDGYTITSWAFLEEPFSAILATRSDGALLCLTWEAEQDVWGWTLLETDGFFERVAAISEGGHDRLYALVRREINGVTRRFHERMALPHVDDITTACHLDCAVTQVYEPPQNTVDGLWHLEGATVSAYYDGYVAHDLVVENGRISLPDDYEATIATVGLRFAGVIETLPLVLNTRQGSAHTNQQNVGKVVVRTIDTRGIEVGITGAAMEPVADRIGEEDGLADVSQRDYSPPIPGHWSPSTTLTIEQNEPMPAHITAIFVEPKVSPK